MEDLWQLANIIKILTLSNLVDNLVERIHKIKCKYGHDKDFECLLEYTNDDLIK